MKKVPQPEEKPEMVALWVISFTDMVTLMLAFFVMLQTLAKEKSGVLFKAGQGSFIRAIDGFGIPDLIYGQQQMSNVDYKKLRFPSQQASEDAPTGRVIDADGDAIRKSYEDIRQLIDSKAAELPSKALNVAVTPIRFATQDRLDSDAAEYLNNFAANLRNDMPMGGYRVYVLGLAPDQPTLQEQLTVSAKRALAVENYLRDKLVSGEQGPAIYSMGDGAASPWGKGITVSSTTAVVIIIMGDSHGR
jgi:outer membrane protein OmpA-like peptidoglycan-associated protein